MTFLVQSLTEFATRHTMFDSLEGTISATFCMIVILIVSIALNIWFYIKSTQLAAKHHQITPTSSRTENGQSRIDTGWWTDATRFQAERRAIFSKVSFHGVEHRQPTNSNRPGYVSATVVAL